MVNDFEQDAKNGTGQNDEDDVDIKNAVCKEGKHHNPDVNRLMLPDDVTAQAKNNVQNDRSNTGLHTFQCKGNIEICSKSRIKKGNARENRHGWNDGTDDRCHHSDKSADTPAD